MNSMMAAIKAKRGNKPDGMYEETQMVEQKPMIGKPESDVNFEGLIASLDEKQKQKLLDLLVNSQKENSDGVEKGEPSPEEKRIIAEKSEEESENEGLPEDESDDIAMSMTDRHAQRMNESGAKPRNLAERARMYMADKLTKKGKI